MRAIVAGAVAVLLGASAVSGTAAERIYSKQQAKTLLERLLLENIVPFWFPGTIDKEHGGYRLNHDDAGKWLGPADKAIVTQARTVWFFSRLYNSKYGKPEHLEAARHGFRFLKDRMWDHENGGFFWSVSDDGSRPAEDQKHMYGQGFGLYRLTRDEKYYDVFEKTLRFIVDEQADWKNGDWHAWVGAPQELKAGPWKGPYHNGRAVLECLQLLDALN